MKFIMFILAMMLMFPIVIQASEQEEITIINNLFQNEDNTSVRFGADFPNLVELRKDTFLGIEASKNINQTSSDEGIDVFFKVTHRGTLLSLIQGE